MISLLAKNISLKVIKAVILSIDTYKQDLIVVGNYKKKKYRWNDFNHFPMQSLLGDNHRLTLFCMAKIFIWIEETKERINDLFIGNMINPTLNINKAFK